MPPTPNQRLNLPFIIHTALLSIIFSLTGFLCQNNPQQHTNCTHPFQCGTLTNISWPFWGRNRPPSCRYPGFQLDCQTGHVPLLNISSVTYRVLHINFSTRTLRVARQDLWNTTCPKTSSLLHNTTLDPQIFRFPRHSNHENITLYYGCTNNNTSQQLSNQFTCDINGVTTLNMYRTGNDASSGLVYCNNSISVPVNQTAGLALKSLTASSSSINVLQDALASGFSIRWSVDNNSICESCRGSGGTCGCNGTVCYMMKQGSKQVSGKCFVQSQGMPPVQSPVPSPGGGGDLEEPYQKLRIWAGVVAIVDIITFLLAITCCYRNKAYRQLVVPVVFWTALLFNISIIYYKRKIHLSVIYGLVNIAFIVMLCIVGSIIRRCSLCCCCCNKENDLDVENFLLQHGSLALKRYKYSEIKKMTKSWRDKLGQGGYGSVYKGKLPDDSLVAVKVLSTTDGNGEDFINEVASISKTSHVNIVNLLGFCFDNKNRALVYEYMPNKSLDKYIGSANADCRLDLEMLYKIAVGVAKGLEYLHTGCSTRIVHFDIKPQNILLDEDFCPKISDFGLAKLCKKKQSLLSEMGTRGTIGYIAPEVYLRNFGGVSHKSDVYSYGMMVLEMAGANTNVDPTHETTTQSSESYFPDRMYEQVVADVIGFTTEEEEETAQKMFLVGFWCIQTNPSERSSISKVLEMLEGSVESIQIPPKPVLSTPTQPVIGFSSSFSSYVETQPSDEGITQT